MAQGKAQAGRAGMTQVEVSLRAYSIAWRENQNLSFSFDLFRLTPAG